MNTGRPDAPGIEPRDAAVEDDGDGEAPGTGGIQYPKVSFVLSISPTVSTSTPSLGRSWCSWGTEEQRARSPRIFNAATRADTRECSADCSLRRPKTGSKKEATLPAACTPATIESSALQRRPPWIRSSSSPFQGTIDATSGPSGDPARTPPDEVTDDKGLTARSFATECNPAAASAAVVLRPPTEENGEAYPPPDPARIEYVSGVGRCASEKASGTPAGAREVSAGRRVGAMMTRFVK